MEIGKLAGQADGAVLVRYGDTVVLLPPAQREQPREGIDFFPLTIDYEERLYAAGKIPGSFFRREGRPTTEAILTARLTDRPLRPLFPKGFRNDVQIVITVLSADQENEPDVLGTIGASTALCISNIPFAGPVSSVRVGYIDGEYVVMPTFAQLKESEIDIIVSSTGEAIMMVEAGANGVSEELILGAIRAGHEANQDIIALQNEIIARRRQRKDAGQTAGGRRGRATRSRQDPGRQARRDTRAVNREERDRALGERREELLERLGETYAAEQILAAFDERVKKQVRAHNPGEGHPPRRPRPAEIRPITAEVGILPRTHGSGLFTRGQTQVLTIATLGSAAKSSDSTRSRRKTPSASSITTTSRRSPSARCGAWARPVAATSATARSPSAPSSRSSPPKTSSPTPSASVTEVLSSNGSTSMASVCGSTLALMDAGVPITEPVAGIAMGLIMGDDGNYKILTDIAGLEDAMGDMDFKVAGTAGGITALQMDIKVKGITPEIMGEALQQAREARLDILDKMRRDNRRKPPGAIAVRAAHVPDQDTSGRRSAP